MGVYIWKERLPSAYQEVEYIRGSSFGGQYIDTGMANISTATKVEYSYTPYTSNQGIICMDNGWDSEGFGNGWDYYYYKNYPGVNMPSNSVGTKVTIVMANDGCSKDGSNIRVPNKSSLSTSGTILLMANRRGGNIDGTPGRDCSLYYYKRWESGVLTQDFVPCYRKSDNVIGMYDLVNDTFYTNSGSGTFTKGADVNYIEHSLKNAYIGEYKEWQPGANTVIYVPMKEDLLDHGPNNISVTNNNSVSIVDGAGYFGGGNKYLSFPNTTNMSGNWTISIRYKMLSQSNQFMFSQGTASPNRGLGCGYFGGRFMGFFYNDYYGSSTAGTDGDWHHITFTYNGGGSSIIYVDGSVVGDGTLSGLTTGNNTGVIGGRVFDGGYYYDGYMSEFIIEDKVWTAQEVADYYNSTKSDYGL